MNNHELVSAIAQSSDPVNQIVGKGSINLVFVVGPLLVRLNHDRDPEAALNEYAREQWCQRQLVGSVRVPEIYEIGTKDDRAYCISEFIPGTWGENGRDRAWTALAELLPIVHQVTPPAASERRELFRESRSPREHWRWQRSLNIESIGPDDQLCRFGVYGPDDADKIASLFNQLPDDGTFGLSHGDVSPRNLLITPDGEPALIDWGCASIGLVPTTDLVDLTHSNILEGNPSDIQLNRFITDDSKQIQTQALLKAFDLVRWAIDRCPTRIDELAAKAKVVKSRVLR